MEFILKQVSMLLFLVLFSCTVLPPAQHTVANGGNTVDDTPAEVNAKDITVHCDTVVVKDKVEILFTPDKKSVQFEIKNNTPSNLMFVALIDGSDYLLNAHDFKITFSVKKSESYSFTVDTKLDISDKASSIMKLTSNFSNFGTFHVNCIYNTDPTTDTNPGDETDDTPDFGGYYSTIKDLSGESLKKELNKILNTNTVRYTYTECWDALKYTDQSPESPENVRLIYTGWSIPKDHVNVVDGWNREHVWCQSRGGFGTDEIGAGTDLHHLRACDMSVNSARNNKEYDNGGNLYIDKSPYKGFDADTGCLTDTDSWEVRDEEKGDTARMIFYCAVAYENSGGYDFVDLEVNDVTDNPTSDGPVAYFGKLSTLKEWHKNDPVSKYEKERHERIVEKQKNRNPFVDMPELVELIW